MGRPENSEITVRGDFVVKDIPPNDINLSAIAARNPQVLKAIAQKNAAEFNLRSAYGNYSPSFPLMQALANLAQRFFPRIRRKAQGLA